MRIGIFTPRSLDPLHPRLLLFSNYFQKLGIAVRFINQSDHGNDKRSRMNWIVLWLIDLYAVQKCKKHVADFDIILINDLKYLALARYAKKLNKIVMYDTIDHNVSLRFYQLAKKWPAIRFFRWPLIQAFIRIEKWYAYRFCDRIIVNSDSLYEYFNGRAEVLYYCSPLESIHSVQSTERTPALLYLGVFSIDKGAKEIIDFQRKVRLPMFVFGTVAERSLLDELTSLDRISYSPKISASELEERLRKLMSVHRLLGFSLIRPVHYSYAVQEANKDIDYLALGIPLIGNNRLPTKEKINAGCGLFFDDPKIEEKINDMKLVDAMSQNARRYYSQKYASSIFYDKLDGIFAGYLDVRRATSAE